MKKSIFGLVAAGALALALASCGNDNNNNNVEPSSEVVDEFAGEGLKVKVLLPDETPAVGVKVQWCSGENCSTPQKTNEYGVARLSTFEETFTYDVHVLNMPEGLTFNPYSTQQNVSNDKVTVKLTNLSVATGEGTKASPYMMNSVGYYNIKIASKDDAKYFVFTPEKAGTYTIESLATLGADPLVGFYGNDATNIKSPSASDDNSGNEKNFKYSITVSETDATDKKAYVFGVAATSAVEFSLLITKN